jgi:hypothetical protein
MMGATEQTTEQPAAVSEDKSLRDRLFDRRALVAGLVALIVFAAAGSYIWTRSSEGSKHRAATTQPTGIAVPGVRPEVVSLTQLRAIAAAGGRSIYWAGRRQGTRLEYTQKTDGTTYVRYLTGSAKAGAPGANYVVVATYSQPNAYARVKKTAEQQHLFVAALPSGAIAVTRPNRPENIYLVFRRRPYQVEVYTPKASETRRIVFGGQIQPVR